MSRSAPNEPQADTPPPVVLVINSGSSSLKFALFRGDELLSTGIAESLGTGGAILRIDGTGSPRSLPGAGHREALHAILGEIDAPVAAVGHRVVHGGEAFSESALIDEEVLEAIRACSTLAPLHNPPNLLGIEAALERFPGVPQVAVFDTAFHQTMEPRAFLYALPHEIYEKHSIRRFGFHGTSHRHVAEETAARLGKPPGALQMITAHLGNGCSACAVKNGRSVDTTMGFTPLEGLVMGTRCGDIDPNLHLHLTRLLNVTLEELTDLLNRRSGLLGLSGLSNDMRTIEAAAARGEPRAARALDVFCHRLAKGMLALASSLDRIDAITFTGGIGENSAEVRRRAVTGMSVLGARIDPQRNAGHGRGSDGRISADDSAFPLLVIPAAEERMIACEAARFLKPATRP